MLYQRKTVANGQNVGEPGPLPAELQGLDDETLADLSAHLDPAGCEQLGYAGEGFVPYTPPPPEPEPVRWVSQAIFLERMTAQKRIPIRIAAKTDPIIEDFLGVLSATVEVYLDDTNLIAGLAYLKAQNLLTDADIAALRA